MSSAKREIWQFHVVVLQWRQTNVKQGVMEVQSCFFPILNLLLLAVLVDVAVVVG